MELNRRRLLQALAATGIGTATLHRAAVTVAQETPDGVKIDKDVLKQAEWISGNELTDEQRESLVRSVKQNQSGIEQLRKLELTGADQPAVYFGTLEAQTDTRVEIKRSVPITTAAVPKRPETDEALAFLPVTELANLVRNRKVSSVELTKLYIARLKKYDPMLKFVVNLTEELAMETAVRADKEIAAGRYRGPLHGIPWGAKDLMSVPGYPTTWGIPQLRDQVLKERATVFHRLEQAGAVLVAKLSLGALAMGDRWYGGMTRCPWNPKIGSSGSSAGSASATAAGCVGFSIGSETLGSILSPSRRCGTSGLRPTFGRVSRHGCMPLSWSMDKLGPITRSVEDTALVLAAIHGADGFDPTAIDKPFSWPPKVDVRGMKVGYVARRSTKLEDRGDLKILRDLGVELVEIQLPKTIGLRAMTDIIGIEGAAVFEKWLNAEQTEGWNVWPNVFRAAQYISAVEYLRIMRHRRKLLFEFEKVMKKVDALINANDLVHTNLTGHPSVVFPSEIRERKGKKSVRSVVLTGRLFDESRLLALANAYQSQLTAHLERPPLDKFLATFEADEEAESADQEKVDDKKSEGKSKKGKDKQF